MSYSIRRFEVGEVDAYRSMRLEALDSEPGVFGNSHAFESCFSEEQWLERVTSINRACFGLYDDGELIGITGIVVDNENKEEAYMTQSYIRKGYRGKGLSRLLYEARMDWAKERGLIRLIIGHKETNYASKAANQKFGFTYTHRVHRTCPDGSTEDMLYYELAMGG